MEFQILNQIDNKKVTNMKLLSITPGVGDTKSLQVSNSKTMAPQRVRFCIIWSILRL